jgi:NAD(P)H-nitrite reductase large subunit
VGRACGAGTGCGGCRPEIAAIIDTEQHVEAAKLINPLRLRVAAG